MPKERKEEPSQMAEGHTDHSSGIVETAFYQMVEKTLEEAGEDFHHPEWRKIVSLYVSEINPELARVITVVSHTVAQLVNKLGNESEEVALVVRTIATTIILPTLEKKRLEQELEKKRKLDAQTREAADIQKFITVTRSVPAIIQRLESAFGPMKILITLERDDEVLLQHRFPKNKNNLRGALSNNTFSYSTTINTIGGMRNYSVSIDPVDSGNDQIGEYERRSIIKPLLDLAIEKREWERLKVSQGNINEIESGESETLPQRNTDYLPFIREVIEKCVEPMDYHESREERDRYISNITKAINICRLLLPQNKDNTDLPRKIDLILGEKMDRDVLDMVKHMIMARDEISSGSGYPSGLNKKDIPLESKIYQVIRAYEALSQRGSIEDVVEKLEEWKESGGYFDSAIIQIFLDELKTFGDPEEIIPPVTHLQDQGDDAKQNRRYREDAYYTPFIGQCRELLSLSKEIREIYWKGRNTTDIKVRDDILKQGDKLQKELHAIADMTTTIILSRHDETESDITGRLHGGGSRDHETLTLKGEDDSLRKGKVLEGELISIYTGPLIRARQTSSIICHFVRNCVFDDILPIQQEGTGSYTIPSCEGCPAVSVEASLMNPKKGAERRGISLWNRVLADSESIKLLGNFVLRLVTSPQDATNVVITHGDTALYLLFCLQTLFEREHISVEKTFIKNDEIIELTIRGGKLLSSEETKTKGLLFPAIDRKTTLTAVNSIAAEIFGEVFFDGKERVRRKSLHNRLLDFIDQKREQDSEQLRRFLQRLEDHPITARMIPIITENIPYGGQKDDSQRGKSKERV